MTSPHTSENTGRRRPDWLSEALAALPMDEAALESLIAAAVDRAGSGSETSADGARSSDAELLRRANRSARVMCGWGRADALPSGALPSGALPTGALPTGALPTDALPSGGIASRLLRELGEQAEKRLSPLLERALVPSRLPASAHASILHAVHARVAEDCASRLRNARAGDLLHAGLAPTTAPGDVDWASAAIEEFERGLPELTADHPFDAGRVTFGSPPRTPGWLWARIRGEVRERTVAMRRRRSVLRTSLLAAGLLATGLIWMQRIGAPPSATPEPVIVFQSVDSPFTDQFSTTSIVRRIRDGG